MRVAALGAASVQVSKHADGKCRVADAFVQCTQVRDVLLMQLRITALSAAQPKAVSGAT